MQILLPYDPSSNSMLFYLTTFYLTIGINLIFFSKSIRYANFFVAAGLYVTLASCIIDPLISGLIFHATSFLKNLKYRLQKVERIKKINNSKTSSYSISVNLKLYKNLKECVRYHNEILK